MGHQLTGPRTRGAGAFLPTAPHRADWVETQGLEDRRGDLRRGHGRVDSLLIEIRMRNEKGDTASSSLKPRQHLSEHSQAPFASPVAA